MTDNITQHPKQNKSPVENAKARIIEEMAKDGNKKIEEQTRLVHKAAQALLAEKRKLALLQTEVEAEKADAALLLEGF